MTPTATHPGVTWVLWINGSTHAAQGRGLIHSFIKHVVLGTCARDWGYSGFLKSKKAAALLELMFQGEMQIINSQINKMYILLVMRVKEIKWKVGVTVGIDVLEGGQANFHGRKGGKEPCGFLGERTAGSRSNKCKGPGAGACLECTRNRQEAGVE